MYHCHFTRFSLRVDPEIIRGDHNPGGRRHIPVLPAASMTPVARIRVGGANGWGIIVEVWIRGCCTVA